MFQRAVSAANGFTYPYVGLRRLDNGRVLSTVATFVVLNVEGWIVTSGHIVDEIVAAERHRLDAEGPSAAEPGVRITDHTEIWGLPAFEATKPRLVYAKVNRAADIAVGRLEPFDANAVTSTAVLRDTGAAPVAQGESVCLVGFPFHNVEATYTPETRGFELTSAAFPVPRFALDGLVSRFRRRGMRDGATGLFIETSSPGLRGQSGGPLLDVDGRIVGIQSHTEHLDLGFDAAYTTAEGQRVTERQFLNVGNATHVDEVRQLLLAEQVAHAVR